MFNVSTVWFSQHTTCLLTRPIKIENTADISYDFTDAFKAGSSGTQNIFYAGFPINQDYYRVHDMFSRIFWIRIYEFFHQYFSVAKENKFLIGQIHKTFFLSFEHLRKSKQKIRRLVFGKFVKICRELDLWVTRLK